MADYLNLDSPAAGPVRASEEDTKNGGAKDNAIIWGSGILSADC